MGNSKVTASLRLSPAKSHVFVVTLAVVGGVCLLTGFAFLAHAIPLWGVPFGTGSGLIGLAWLAWLKSHRDVDLHGSLPTVIKNVEPGFEVTTDARTLIDSDMGKAFARVVTILANRGTLPEPDGLIGPDKQPIPGTERQASEVIRKANEEARNLKSAATQVVRESPVAIQDDRIPMPESIPSDRLPPPQSAIE